MSISLEQFKREQEYEALPPWRQFLYAWKMSIVIGPDLRAVYRFPLAYLALRRAIREVMAMPEKEQEILARLNKKV